MNVINMLWIYDIYQILKIIYLNKEEIPSLILAGRDENGLGGVETEGPDPVKVGAKGVLGSPGLAECFL